jgi:predicted ribosome quality control (RQC) complex YloA/Tae2 family protein
MEKGGIMSLNWRELQLICSELPLKESRLQSVVQHDFHSLSWSFHHPDEGRWTLYTEIGTPNARIHRETEKTAPTQTGKTSKLQRFIQYCRAHLEGCRIVEASTIPGDRILHLHMEDTTGHLHVFFRLYSGAGANIIITDDKLVISELLYRRPGRDETAGKPFPLPEPKEDDGRFPIRPREEGLSFNRQIELAYGRKSTDETAAQLRQRIEQQRDRKLRELEGSVKALLARQHANENFEHDKQNGDLLASNLYLLKADQHQLEVDDWFNGGKRLLILDPKLSSKQNIELYYQKYQKKKGTFQNAQEEYRQALENYRKQQAYYEHLLSHTDDESDIRRFKKALGEQTADKPKAVPTVGLVLHSGSFTLLVGRNAKENDQLLRRYTRGNDWWMHTRDYPGGYVFIKAQKDKSIPLDVILDAANLAITYSRAKNSGKADLYFTQVKYLRRAKDGPLGLVLPTHEKNIVAEIDEKRLERLFSEKEA